MRENLPTIEETQRELGLLNAYKKTITQLYPFLGYEHVHNMSIKDDEGFALARFLNSWPQDIIVVEVGTFVGVSAFHFAGQRKVTEVLSIDPNPSLAELGAEWDLDWQDKRVHTVAAEALSRFPGRFRKISLLEGTAESVERSAASSDAMPMAFVDGDHSQIGVETDLKAVFAQHGCSMAILHDCRKPAVLAAALGFVARSPGQRHFRFLQHDRSTVPNLGLVLTREISELVDDVAVGPVYGPVESLARAAGRLSSVWEQQTEQTDKQRQHAMRLGSKLLEMERLKDLHKERAETLRERLRALRNRRRTERKRN